MVSLTTSKLPHARGSRHIIMKQLELHGHVVHEVANLMTNSSVIAIVT